MFRGLFTKDSNKLQCVHNSLASIVINTSKFSHITPTLESLHWQPIKYRYIFKTLTIIYKYLHNGQPKYFSPHLSLYTCSVNTRRSNPDNFFLRKPSFSPRLLKSTVQFKNSFAYDGPNLYIYIYSSIWGSFIILPLFLQAQLEITSVSQSFPTLIFLTYLAAFFVTTLFRPLILFIW